MLRRRLLSLLVSVAIAATTPTSADDPVPDAKPLPAMQVEPLPHHQAVFLRDGRELMRYHFDPADRRPFLYPLIGPSGVSLTRMGHPHDPVTHSHHNSVWISYHIVNDVNFWGDHGKDLGRIVHQQMQQYDDGDEAAALTAINHWKRDASDEVLLVERRRIEFRQLPNDEYVVVIDFELTAEKKPVTLGKTSFGPIGVRMRKSIGVHDGGGRIRNSVGGVNEKGLDGAEGVFWKPAKWCDYSGLAVKDAVEGIALFDHPQNPSHPSPFHVRDDGWMGACLTFDAPRTIEVGTPLRLRYGLYVHAGLPPTDAIDAQWQAFAELPMPESLAPVKKK